MEVQEGAIADDFEIERDDLLILCFVGWYLYCFVLFCFVRSILDKINRQSRESHCYSFHVIESTPFV